MTANPPLKLATIEAPQLSGNVRLFGGVMQTEVTSQEDERQSVFHGKSARPMYLAFVDILGFGDRVKRGFDEVLKVYDDVLHSAEILKGMREEVIVRVYSDAFLLSCERLGPLVGVIQGLHMQTLSHDCLIRGGIGYGEHIEAADDNNLYVVSQALVKAVDVEKSIKYPCVAFHPEIVIPQEWWKTNVHPIYRGVLCFEGIKLVNPFNRYWFQSSMTRVAMAKRETPEHKEKHDWFLRLYEAVASGQLLVP